METLFGLHKETLEGKLLRFLIEIHNKEEDTDYKEIIKSLKDNYCINGSIWDEYVEQRTRIIKERGGESVSFENVKQWFARDIDNRVITIDKINKFNKKSTFFCPICGSSLIPKAIESKKVTPHFAHVDLSSCNAESMVHWWFKNKFIEPGDKFYIKTDDVIEYVCKEIKIEPVYKLSNGKYNPDISIKTECNQEIIIEMQYSNKKNVEDYIDYWLELNKTIVEVDIKRLKHNDEVYTLAPLFHDGKCRYTKKNDLYHKTIGQYKEEIFKTVNLNEYKMRIEKLDWFWQDVFRYKKDEISIEEMVLLIDSFDEQDKEIIESILDKKSCNGLRTDYLQFKNEQRIKDEIHKFKVTFNKDNNDFSMKYKTLENSHIEFTVSSVEKLDSDIETIKDSIKISSFTAGKSVESVARDLVDMLKIEQIKTSRCFIETLSEMQKKYNDDLYEVLYKRNGLYLYYNSFKCLTVCEDVWSQIKKLKNAEKLFKVFDKRIMKYMKNLVPIPSPEKLCGFLEEKEQTLKFIRDQISDQSIFVTLDWQKPSEEEICIWIKRKCWDRSQIGRILIKKGILKIYKGVNCNYKLDKTLKVHNLDEEQYYLKFKGIIEAAILPYEYTCECAKVRATLNDFVNAVQGDENMHRHIEKSLAKRCEECREYKKKQMSLEKIEHYVCKVLLNYNLDFSIKRDYCGAGTDDSDWIVFTIPTRNTTFFINISDMLVSFYEIDEHSKFEEDFDYTLGNGFEELFEFCSKKINQIKELTQ
ncbi:hypothetical protein ACL9SS_18940 [Bacillus subtilis]|uniref:competence protein CoiA family protein n=2 Tax=Bacillaceae TaxID=186817 RepID=UPI0013D150D9|nr:hypothetical protein [Bacillus subtilis]CAF1823056.1 hypothetical protein NRS6085_04206 [Bacillus subtilis]CAI6273806.1 hypothetical protein NRS6085_11255 [Bacillus subtilis]